MLTVIRTLADDSTRDVWNGVNSKAAPRIPKDLWPVVRRKLDQIDAVTSLDDLRVPPGRGHVGGGAGFYGRAPSRHFQGPFLHRISPTGLVYRTE